jgi:type III restriction enzyme
MSKPELKQYQETARDKLSNAIRSLLGRDSFDDRLIVFKSPTGSGKTLTMAYALAATHSHPNRPEFIVLWLSPGKGGLHLQSARALKFFLEGTSMKVRVLESRDDITADPSPTSGTVLVVNWEKLFRQEDGEFTNVMLREGETTSFFDMLQNVTQSGMDMVVVIDESHVNLDGPKTKRLMEELRTNRPFIQIEMSATPSTATLPERRDDGIHHDVVVRFSEVEEAGMVRKTVLLNPEFDAVQKKYPKESLDLQVLNAAWDRIAELRTGYRDEGSDVEPLLLIQYPDGKNAEARAEVVERFLAQKGLVKDETYATYLSGDHSDDLENIARSDSPYKALIFKQAIATGWDCPRAQVLVQFRDPRSATFRIQTLGRIMRAPEQRHYENEDLNIAYVYSDLEGVEVDVVADDPDFKVRDKVVKRGPTYPAAGLRLRSVFQPRRRELHYPIRENIEKALVSSLDARISALLPAEPFESTPVSFLADARVEVKDLVASGEGAFAGDQREGLLGPELAQAFYDRVLTQDIEPYRSREQSRSRIKTILVNWVRKQRPDWNPEQIQHFVLRNQSEVSGAIAVACENCASTEDAQAIAAARAKMRINEEWEVPVSDLVSDDTHEPSAEGNLLDPALIEKSRSGPERRFETWVAAEHAVKRVRWWWKNGERDEKYLGIEYTFGTQVERTYPDFLVMDAAGTLWVLEVKDVDDPNGATGAETNAKAIGLAAWANEHNKRRKTDSKLFESPAVKTGVVVVQQEGGAMVARIGDPSGWTPPSKANLAAGQGWAHLALGSGNTD